MVKRAVAAAIALCVWSEMQSFAQHSATTGLLLRVPPEARVDPPQLALRFRISADGASDVLTNSALFTARVRPAAGRAVRVLATLTDWQGPGGAVPASILRWTGSATNGIGGGSQAGCSTGSFGSAGSPDLVQGWVRSGSLTCSVTFELINAPGLAPGVYSGFVRLAAQ